MTASKMSGKTKKINLEVLGLSWNLTDLLFFVLEYFFYFFFPQSLAFCQWSVLLYLWGLNSKRCQKKNKWQETLQIQEVLAWVRSLIRSLKTFVCFVCSLILYFWNKKKCFITSLLNKGGEKTNQKQRAIISKRTGTLQCSSWKHHISRQDQNKIK